MLIKIIFLIKVQLQNMLTSKYIGHFLTEVTSWQKNLSQADQVISIILDVQRTWSHLESIFIGSEDIRKQLPEDSKRFDGIDVDFKVSLNVFHHLIGVKLVFEDTTVTSTWDMTWYLHLNFY